MTLQKTVVDKLSDLWGIVAKSVHDFLQGNNNVDHSELQQVFEALSLISGFIDDTSTAEFKQMVDMGIIAVSEVGKMLAAGSSLQPLEAAMVAVPALQARSNFLKQWKGAAPKTPNDTWWAKIRDHFVVRLASAEEAVASSMSSVKEALLAALKSAVDIVSDTVTDEEQKCPYCVQACSSTVPASMPELKIAHALCHALTL